MHMTVDSLLDPVLRPPVSEGLSVERRIGSTVRTRDPNGKSELSSRLETLFLIRATATVIPPRRVIERGGDSRRE